MNANPNHYETPAPFLNDLQQLLRRHRATITVGKSIPTGGRAGDTICFEGPRWVFVTGPLVHAISLKKAVGNLPDEADVVPLGPGVVALEKTGG